MVTQEQLERKIQERPSALDRSRLCPASLYPGKDEVLIEVIGDDDNSAIGQGAHEVFKAIAKDEEYNLEEVAIKHGVKKSDLDYLKYTAYKCVEILNESFDVETWQAEEKQISLAVGDLDYHLEGTPDLSGITRDGKTLIVADYKTGISSASHEHQIKAYCHILLSKAPATIEKVVGVILWARDLEAQPWTWTREDITRWVHETRQIIDGWDGVSYAVGDHCTFCRRASGCKARQAKLNEMYGLIATVDSDEEIVGVAGGALLAHMYEASKAIPKLVDSWRKRLKEQVKIQGDLDMGDGKVLTLKERNGASVIDTAKASALLKEEWSFEPEEVLALCKMSKTALETEIGERAAKGMKGKDKKAVVEALKEAGALHQPVNHVLAVVDKQKEVTSGK